MTTGVIGGIGRVAFYSAIHWSILRLLDFFLMYSHFHSKPTNSEVFNYLGILLFWFGLFSPLGQPAGQPAFFSFFLQKGVSDAEAVCTACLESTCLQGFRRDPRSPSVIPVATALAANRENLNDKYLYIVHIYYIFIYKIIFISHIHICMHVHMCIF